MTCELWKPIPGQERYSVSNHGRVRGTRGGLIKPAPQKSGHLRFQIWCQLTRKNISFSVQRAVALAFLPNPHGLPIVNHKDSNRTNNEADNLEWCDYSHNNRHAWREGHRGVSHYQKFEEEKILAAITCLMAKSHTQRTLAKALGMSTGTVSDLNNGRIRNLLLNTLGMEGGVCRYTYVT
jgi:DNA-binding Xre family transcriptional regulator